MPQLWSEGVPHVIELGSGIPAAYAARLLADFDADVIKIESPTDLDSARTGGPFPGDVVDPEASGLFIYLNSGKRSVLLDPTEPSDAAVLGELLATADAVIENLGPGAFDALPIPAEAIPERLVVCSISPYGQDGPKANYLASEIGLYASGGMLYITGDGAREPVKHGLHQAAHLAGVSAAAATLTGLMYSRATGIGPRIDISEQEVVAQTMFPALNIYSHTGGVMRRAPSGTANLVNSSPMETADGYIMPSYAGLGDWENLMRFLDLPALAAERFLTPGGRLTHADEIDAQVGPKFRTMSKRELFHEGQAWGFTFTAVQDAADLSHCEHLAARSFLAEPQHPGVARVVMPGRVPAELPHQARPTPRAAPRRGEHTADVLAALGSTRTIAREAR
jgi:crotonobetainyl-CoA:carnitine CoA-transferase CaiB-like acyl-CoA transferase